MPQAGELIIGNYYYTDDIKKKSGVSNKLVSIIDLKGDDVDHHVLQSVGKLRLGFQASDTNKKTFFKYVNPNTDFSEDTTQCLGELCTISGGKKTRRKIKKRNPRKSIKRNKRKSSKK